MRKLWRWAIIGAAAAALSGGLVVTAAQAGATARPTTQTTQAQHHAMLPATCTTARNYRSGYATFTYCDGHYSRYGCTAGNNAAIYGPLYAANGCSTQLFLWLTHTLSGTPDLCVNPQSSTNTLKRYYEEFKVTSRTGNCGT